MIHPKLQTKLLFATSLVAFAGTAIAQSSDEFTLEEIVVTAQKRDENIQRSALAITAVTAEVLDDRGVSNAQDLQRIVPGLQVSPAGNNTNFTIRGITNDMTGESASLSIAYGQDGNYSGRASGASSLMFDVERVEVLKGPQGSLAGTNAAGGSINVITKRPTQQFEGSAALEIGNYDTIKTQGALNLPINDWIAVRGAFGTAKHDGYYDNGAAVARGSQDDTAGRLRALFNFSDDVSLLLGGNYYRGEGVSFSRPYCHNSTTLTPTQGGCDAGPFSGDAYTYALSSAGTAVNQHTIWGFSAELNWKLPFADLTYIGAYSDDGSQTGTFVGYTYLNADGSTNGASISSGGTVVAPSDGGTRKYLLRNHELRLSNQNDFIKWVAGVYLSAENNYMDDRPTVSLVGFAGQQSAESRALFGQLTYSLTDTFRVTAGGRYNRDHKFEDAALCGPFGAGGTFGCNPTVSDQVWTYTTWRAGVEYDVAPESMLYATVSTGIKPGGYNNSSAPANLRYFNQEKLTDYEIGLKNRFFDNRLQLNLSAYYYDYKDRQVTYTFEAGPPAIGGTLNAANASSTGVDVDVAWLPTKRDRVNVTANWLDAKFTDFVIDALLNRTDTALTHIDYTGLKLARSPEWVINLGYEHGFDMPGGGLLTPRADFHYEAAQKMSFDPYPYWQRPSYVVTDLALTYTPSAGNWKALAYLRNAADTVYVQSLTGNTFVETVRGTAVLGDPRTFGLRFEAKF